MCTRFFDSAMSGSLYFCSPNCAAEYRQRELMADEIARMRAEAVKRRLARIIVENVGGTQQMSSHYKFRTFRR